MIAPPILCTGWPPRVPPSCASCGAPCLWQTDVMTEEFKAFSWVCPDCPAEVPAT